LLALHTGARLEELGQLRPSDVMQISYPDADGANRQAWFIRLKEDAEGNPHLKTAGSERDVPVHPTLESLGFIAFAQAAEKAKQPRIFPKLTPDKYGRLTAKWGEWFGSYLRTVCGISDKRMVFHSFRHTFKQYARHAGIIEGVQRQIMGHGSADVADTYGSGYPLHQVVEGMAAYRVPGLSLSSDEERRPADGCPGETSHVLTGGNPLSLVSRRDLLER
jgi:integrase